MTASQIAVIVLASTREIIMAKQFFKVYVKYPGALHSVKQGGFLGCEQIQCHIMQLIKESVPIEDIKVMLDVPGVNPPDVTKWQVGQALKRMGRKP